MAGRRSQRRRLAAPPGVERVAPAEEAVSDAARDDADDEVGPLRDSLLDGSSAMDDGAVFRMGVIVVSHFLNQRSALRNAAALAAAAQALVAAASVNLLPPPEPHARSEGFRVGVMGRWLAAGSDDEVIRRLRISVRTFRLICDAVRGSLQRRVVLRKAWAGPVDDIVAVSISILADKAGLRKNADLNGLDKSTASRWLSAFCEVFDEEMRNRVIAFPGSRTEAASAVRAGFSDRLAADVRGSFNGVRGAIDGSHIRIFPSPGRHYINRNNYPSILLLAIVDSRQRFLYANVGQGGSVHDSRALMSSPFWSKAADLFSDGSYLIGDCGFPCLPWLLTPFRETARVPQGLPPEACKLFNRCLARMRVVVEHAFARLKSRFRCLEWLEVSRTSRASVVMACIMLHNLSLEDPDSDEAIPYPSDEESEGDDVDRDSPDIANDGGVDSDARDQIVRALWGLRGN